MSARLYSYCTGDPVDTVEMHVLAKAYRAAWRAMHAHEPTHRHVIFGVDLIIDFGEIGSAIIARRPLGLDHNADDGASGVET